MAEDFVSFFVVGAAKSGTTTLHELLATHPEICLPKIKETNFYAFMGQNVDFRGPLDDCTINRFSITRFQDYKTQFRDFRAGQLRGEICPLYLYSPVAAEAIVRYNPNARIIIILRNPAERAYSNYLHLVRDGRETLSFEEALAQEEKRIDENWEWFWHVRRQGFYAVQLKRYLQTFPENNVKVLIFEKFFSDLERSLAEMCSFIGVSRLDMGSLDRRVNVSGRPLHLGAPLYNLLLRPGPVNRFLRQILPEGVRKNMSGSFKDFMIRPERIPCRIREQLISIYRDDISELESMLQTDLGMWYMPENAGS